MSLPPLSIGFPFFILDAVESAPFKDGGQKSFNNPEGATHRSGNSYVLGARSKTVYIYNECGVIATFQLQKFRDVGNK